MLRGYDAALFAAADRHMSRGGGPSGTYETTVDRDEGDASGQLAEYDVEVEVDDGRAQDEAHITRVYAGRMRKGDRIKLTAQEVADFSEAFCVDYDESAYDRRGGR